MSLLLPEVRIWKHQRTLDTSRVDEIAKYQDFYYMKHGRYHMIHWNFCACRLNGILYLIDGQHRYFARKKLAEKFPQREIPEMRVSIEDVKSESEIAASFEEINKLQPVPDEFVKGMKPEVKEK